MRRLLICGIAALASAQASAADMSDFLRGSNTVISAPGGGVRWEGFYVGGHLGYSVPGIDFTNNTPMVGALAAMTPIASRTVSPLGNQDSTNAHFGGFIGYNTQWDGAIVSLEAGYSSLNKSITATNTITGSFGTPGDQLVYTGAGSVTARIIDYGTLRVRGGWATDSFFMPYATFGLAVGRMDITRTVLITPAATAGTPPGTFVPAPTPVSENLNGQFGYGWTAGVGVDFSLMSNLFLRAEYEYVQFPDFQGLNAHIHNARIGAALKF